MRRFILILLVVVMSGAACADFISVVKNTRNAVGLYCSEIPTVIESKLGYRDLAQDWLESRLNGSYKVLLKITAQKDVQVDGIYMSYNWRPEYVWEVEKQSRQVTPANTLARNWMDGKI